MGFECLRATSRRVGDRFTWILVAAVMLANGILLYQNWTLRESVTRRLLDLQELKVGKQLAGVLAGTALDAAFRPIEWPQTDAQHLLLITFSPGCPACQDNQGGWSLIAGELARRKTWRVLWVSRDPLGMTLDYCKAHSIPFETVIADPTHRTYLQLGLQMVPNTLVVGRGGVIEKLWTGRLDLNSWRRVFADTGVPDSLLPKLEHGSSTIAKTE